MKIKHNFTIQEIGNIKVAVTPDYQGIIRLNDASRFIFESLREETTEAALSDALCTRYDAPKEVLQADLTAILAQLRSAELLEE